MFNLALYRKYRPQTFAEFIGQDHVVQTLSNAIGSGLISHAYLFAGPKGSGKTTLARILAKSLNCQNPQKFNPCNKCSSCLEIMGGRAMDLIEIDAASHRGIDEMKELINGIRFAPVKSKYKVFIIDESHQITKDAANALLKTLEEPPSHAIFVLATTEAHKMIPTIISRCQRFDFKRIKIPEIIKKLEIICQKENIKFENSALSLIALNSQGSFRDAESLLDSCISFAGLPASPAGGPVKAGSKTLIKNDDVKDLLGIVEVSQISRLVDLISSKNQKEAISFLNEITDKGVDLQEFSKSIVYYLRQVLLFKIGPELLKPETSGFTEEELKKVGEQADILAEARIKKMLEFFLEAESKIKYASITQLPLELAIVDSCEI